MVQPCHYKIRGPKKVCGTLCPLWIPLKTSGVQLCCTILWPKESQEGKLWRSLGHWMALAKTMITKGIERPNAGTLAFCSALSDPFHSVASPGDMLVGPQLPVRLPRLSSLLWAPGGRCYHIGWINLNNENDCTILFKMMHFKTLNGFQHSSTYFNKYIQIYTNTPHLSPPALLPRSREDPRR